MWAKFAGLLAVLPCLWVVAGSLPRTVKGFRRFYTQGCREFYTAFAIYLQGFRRFSV
nr:MAG TPA: hypothetical protein [Caudoviricetes sp.]DAX34128.1 MAG TPA: hypothetical protein [Caudoviricetes sp.]